jgi:hypothetical protein
MTANKRAEGGKPENNAGKANRATHAGRHARSLGREDGHADPCDFSIHETGPHTDKDQARSPAYHSRLPESGQSIAGPSRPRWGAFCRSASGSRSAAIGRSVQGQVGSEAACLLSGMQNGKADADMGEVLRQKAARSCTADGTRKLFCCRMKSGHSAGLVSRVLVTHSRHAERANEPWRNSAWRSGTAVQRRRARVRRRWCRR